MCIRFDAGVSVDEIDELGEGELGGFSRELLLLQCLLFLQLSGTTSNLFGISIVAILSQIWSRNIHSIIRRSGSSRLPPVRSDRANPQHSILVLLQLDVALAESLAESLNHVVELSDQLALDHHLLAGHLQLEVLVHHLSDVVGDKLVHFGLSHELGDDVEDDGALFVPELLKDAVVGGDSTGE